MFTTKKYSTIALSIVFLTVLSISVFGQHDGHLNQVFVETPTAFPNPLLLEANKSCRPENLNTARFDKQISLNQQMVFCKTLQEISVKLNRNWSPDLLSEMQQIWRVFVREDVKIHLMEKNVSSNVRAMTTAFTENNAGKEFNATLFLRLEQVEGKSFLLIFTHELRHVFDFYEVWKNKTSITEAELEKRAFRITGKINQELPANDRFSKLPAFWEDNWKRLPANEIDAKRDEKIENFMRSNSAYKHLLKTPEKFLVGYLSIRTPNYGEITNLTVANDGEKLPRRLQIRQTKSDIPQQIKQLSFRMAKAANPQNPNELLRATLINEKNLFYKMDNFVYDQNLQLQCWQKQKVTENHELNRLIARTQNGEALLENEKISSGLSKSLVLPSCVLNFETIKSDATDTFWAAPYLDQMTVKFNYFTVIDGIPVARYTVFAPDVQKFKQIASLYPNIKNFRAFVGTIFVSVADAQIIKFWGTSFPESDATGYKSANTFGSYCATAIRQKLASGIWVTTLLNTVAVTNKNNKLKPFSYVVNYRNYRQATTSVTILDDVAIPSKY